MIYNSEYPFSYRIHEVSNRRHQCLLPRLPGTLNYGLHILDTWPLQTNVECVGETPFRGGLPVNPLSIFD